MEFLGKGSNDGRTKEIKTGWLVFSKHYPKHYGAMRKTRYTIEVEISFVPFPSEVHLVGRQAIEASMRPVAIVAPAEVLQIIATVRSRRFQSP